MPARCQVCAQEVRRIVLTPLFCLFYTLLHLLHLHPSFCPPPRCCNGGSFTVSDPVSCLRLASTRVQMGGRKRGRGRSPRLVSSACVRQSALKICVRSRRSAFKRLSARCSWGACSMPLPPPHPPTLPLVPHCPPPLTPLCIRCPAHTVPSRSPCCSGLFYFHFFVLDN